MGAFDLLRNCRPQFYGKMKMTRADHLNFGLKDQTIRHGAVPLIPLSVFASGLDRVVGSESTTLTLVHEAII